ncbi:hypothetical protein VSO92_08665 [Myroides pelagicus]|uniref:hypothetical protein n=1 Tax=Myroides pelagicus TaxID=270914 RepID=UPI002DBC2158|nr:hypothetical protein [Myroides pelagicus]MEC4114178.1 hypothetical protein [Myroides pelagicus]
MKKHLLVCLVLLPISLISYTSTAGPKKDIIKNIPSLSPSDSLRYAMVEIQGVSYRFLIDPKKTTTISSDLVIDHTDLGNRKVIEEGKKPYWVKLIVIDQIKVGNETLKEVKARYENLALFEQIDISGILGTSAKP